MLSLQRAFAICQHASHRCSCVVSRASGSRLSSTSASRSSARTRLADDLTPRSRSRPRSGSKSSKILDVAPRSFQRDTVPHSEFPDRNRLSGGKKLNLSELFLQRRMTREGRRARRPPFSEQQQRSADRPDSPRAQSPSWKPGARPESMVDRTRSRYSPTRAGVEKATMAVEQEFDFSTTSPPLRTLPATFASPPLTDGLLASVRDILGPDGRPTPIQSLSLKHVFQPPGEGVYRQFLLASETGSGKSLAYLLPMLQDIKRTEGDRDGDAQRRQKFSTNPRGIVLAPTHELSRQLAAFAKALVHHDKLRVQSASRANVASDAPTRRVSAAKMANQFGGGPRDGEFVVRSGGTGHDVDVLVGTPSKILEMVRGHGWDREAREDEPARKWTVGRPEAGLANVEWVVVDEADILFDPDFIDETRMLLSDIATARGYQVPGAKSPHSYPFNLLLTSATIPASLAAHLDVNHPNMVRLVSPQLHRLPSKLELEFVAYSSGNRHADVERKLRDLWSEDALEGRPPSRAVIFGNTRTGVDEMGKYLEGKGLANISVTGTGGRAHGSNKHLTGFLKPILPAPVSAEQKNAVAASPATDDGPRVLLSTSLLARGLDFDPSVSTVFVLDPPRNTADFLHRAGRTARAGRVGKVVVFEKREGRGSERGKDMRRKIKALTSKAR